MRGKEKGKKTAKRVWLKDSEVRDISDILKPEIQTIFNILISTGCRYSLIRDLKFSSLNLRTMTIHTENSTLQIPVSTQKYLLEKRDMAISESDKVFTQTHKAHWSQVSSALFKLKIDIKVTPIKLLRFSYARKHFLFFKSKKKLLRDLQITTLRHIPKQLFDIPQVKPCMSF